MWTKSKAKSLDLQSRAMTEFEAAAEAWEIGDAFAGDAFSDDGNSLSASGGPCPTQVGWNASRGPVAWEARERPARRTIATTRPAAMGVAAAPTSPALGTVAGPGLAAADVASRYHRRDLLQGMND